MKRKPKMIISIIALSALAFGLGCCELMRGFITHPNYMKWALFGGDYRHEFLRSFLDDKFSRQIVDGKTVDELKKWFPQMRSTQWLNDKVEKELNKFNPDYAAPKRTVEEYETGVDEGVGIFFDVQNGRVTRAYILKDIPNQRTRR